MRLASLSLALASLLCLSAAAIAADKNPAFTDAAKAGRDITHLRFRVRDGSGATLFTLPFCETITRS